MSSPKRAFVALGSNLGDRQGHLAAALAALRAPDGVRLAAVSAAFENPAVGGPPQPDYLNAVLEVVTTLAPKDLWRRLRAIEDERGRVRVERDGPRTLDLDLLAVEGEVSSAPDVTLPHPRATDRAFTLLPWAEIAPEFVVPGTGKTVLEHEALGMRRDPAAFHAMRRAAIPAAGAPAGKAPVVLADRAALDAFRAKAAGPVGFVPTLGALHEGHASHARRARAECATVVASIFVNPLQFGPKEDFTRYPRTFESDVARLGAEGCDAVYAPTAGDLYPAGFSTHVEVDGVSSAFEGAARPGHFRGVATVVAKLLVRLRPDRAYFGRADALQCVGVKRVAADLGPREGAQDFGPRAVPSQPPRHDEAVAAVAPLAAHDDHTRSPPRHDENRFEPLDRLGGAAPGVFHKGGAGNPELTDRPAVEPPHLLRREQGQHWCYRLPGSAAACTRKSARIAVYVSRNSARAARGSSMWSARAGSRRMPFRFAPAAA